MSRTTKTAVITYVSEQTSKKLKVLAELDDRTLSKYVKRLLEKTINEYEKENGTIEY